MTSWILCSKCADKRKLSFIGQNLEPEIENKSNQLKWSELQDPTAPHEGSDSAGISFFFVFFLMYYSASSLDTTEL